MSNPMKLTKLIQQLEKEYVAAETVAAQATKRAALLGHQLANIASAAGSEFGQVIPENLKPFRGSRNFSQAKNTRRRPLSVR